MQHRINIWSILMEKRSIFFFLYIVVNLKGKIVVAVKWIFLVIMYKFDENIKEYFQ